VQIVISLNALLGNRKMIVANDSGQFLTTDGWQTLGPAFAIDAGTREECFEQLKKFVDTFWDQIEVDNVIDNTQS